MARGQQFRPQQTDDQLLTGLQGDIRDTFSQLEEFRRGLLVADTAVFSSDTELAEQLFVLYSGAAGATIKLPLAALRGAGKSQFLAIMNGSRGSITLRRAGSDTVSGGATAVLSTGQMALLVSNGKDAWYIVNPSGDGRDWGAYKQVPGASGLSMHFIAGAATAAPLAASTPLPNALFAVPFIAPQRGGTLDVIGFEYTAHSAGAGNVIVGCYDAISDSNIYPNVLLSGTVGAFNVGVLLPLPGIASGTVSVPLTPGKVYFLAYNADAGANGAGTLAPPVSACHPMFGVNPAAGVSATPNVAIRFPLTYTGALPATFPAGGFYTDVVGIGLRGRIS